MPGPAGGHVRIGTREYELAERIGGPDSLIRPHFNEHFDSLLNPNTVVDGAPGEQNLDPAIMRWLWSDWSGGEGLFVYRPDDPTQYDYGRVNPRTRGLLAPPPLRTDGVVTSLIAPAKAFLANAGGFLYAAGGTGGANAFTKTTTDGVAWTSRTHGIAGGFEITAVGSDPKYLYIATLSGGTRRIYRITDSTNVQFSTDEGASVGARGLAVLQFTLLSWTGSRLFAYDTTAGLTVPSTIVYTAAPDYSFADPFPAGSLAGMCATDQSVCMFYSDGGGWTQVHQYKAGVGSPIWGGSDSSLNGFTGRAIGFAGGVLYLAGTYGPQAGLWALDLADNSPSYIGDFRKTTQTTLTPVAISTGLGAQVLITMAEGFTGRAIGFAGGVLYLAGTYGPQAGLWALDLADNSPSYIGDFRKTTQTTLTPVAISTGLGAQVLVTMAEGFTFVYDPTLDAISELDERTNLNAATAVRTYRDKRVTLYQDTPNTSIKSSSWANDDSDRTTDRVDWVSPAYDYGLPFERNKALIGFVLSTDPLVAGQSVEIDYQLNEDGTWHQAAVVDSTWVNPDGQTSATDNIVYVTDSKAVTGGTGSVGTVKMGKLRIRMRITSARVRSLTTIAYNMNASESFDVVVKLTSRSQELDSDADPVEVRRQYLIDLMRSKVAVTFQNYYSFTDRGDGDTFLVAIENVESIVDRNSQNISEGRMRLTLRNLAVA